MECTDISSSEQEEGEIIDDLEEISDGSMAPPSPKMGKLNIPEENLRAISLSSVSDLEVMDSSIFFETDRKVHRRRQSRRRKKPPPRQASSGSSSEDEEMVRTKKLLQKALERDLEEIHNNSLRTRLKKITQNTPFPQEQEIDSLDCDTLPNGISSPQPIEISNLIENEVTNEKPVEADGTCNTVSPDVDDELIQLRLEALKTAVINKFQRKKRKVKTVNQEESKTEEVNKENSSDNVNAQSSSLENVQQTTDNSQQVVVSPSSAMNSEEDVDVDILRAVLLASMSKKITQKDPPTDIKKTRDAKNLKVPPKKQFKAPQPIKSIDPPKIQPIIISINNPDSDSDIEFNDTVNDEKIDKSIEKKELEMKIDKFLKQQRAEVEAKNNLSVPKISPKKTSQTEKIVKMNSLYKLLPQSKQLEYEELIRKLKIAEKRKPKVRRLSRSSDNKVIKSKVSLKTAENNLSNRLNPSGSQEKQLRQVQHQMNGRLQEKGNYHELSPLLKRMEQINIEQKKHEVVIGKLLNQLNNARSQSLKLQKVFNDLMQDFMKKKAAIDTNIKMAPAPRIIGKPTALVPGTVGKPIAPEPRKVVKPASPVLRAVVKPTLKAKDPKPKSDVMSKTTTESLHSQNKKPVMLNNTRQCKVVLEKCPVRLEDPNDIEFRTLTSMETSDVPNKVETMKVSNKAKTSDIPKYTSPLEYMESKNHRILNPMGILCPYEMDGICRDKDCTFNHCPSNL